MKLQDRAEGLPEGVFLGGRAEGFEAMGRLLLITLLRCGLYPDSRVLDFGCGCLRGGYWIVNFLEPDRYFGIECNEEMLKVGREEILGSELAAAKRPRFLTNDRFDPADFGVEFDFFIARSVWTHASQEQIRRMLDAFVAHGAADSVFLTSYLPARRGEGYAGPDWVGRSHESNTRGMVRHEFPWIKEECRRRSLEGIELTIDRKRQTWLLIAKGQGARPAKTYLADLFADDKPKGIAQRVKAIVNRMRRRLIGGKGNAR